VRRLWVGILAAASLLPAAVAAPVEQVVGGIDAMVFVCTPIDAKSARAGQDILERAREQRKLDLPTIRTTDGYRSVYNAEVNRLLAQAPKERLAACQSAW
jgi:hypothetical protein